MYEELYAPLPDSGRYLERIGWQGPADLTKEALSGLVFAHQKAVPFENYDICELGRPIILETLHLYEKIVANRRGGYCFELNAGFAALLSALGFEVWPVLARIYRGPMGEQPMPPMHRVNLICIGEDKYFTDVGFGGPMPAGALLLKEGDLQEVWGVTYRFERRPHHRWTLFRETSEKVMEPMIGFTEVPSEPVDFLTPNYHTSTHPDSLFTRTRMANIRFDDGFASINTEKFHIVRGERDETTEIQSKEQEFALLKEYFGISL
ncbi:MAG: arylamine N-acetyltransferase [Clostridiales bacterium]|nr:arylamine N-acetyltransferase [Clostridiales bacterium]